MLETTSTPTLQKSPTGILGFDDITGGGLPTGRPSLVCGAPGCGKTMFAMSFLVNGATQVDEPGVFMTFEERVEDLALNCASLGHDLDALVTKGRLAVDHVVIDRSEIEETGAYDLDGLFVRLGFAVDQIQAKRVVIDTIEVLFAGFTNTAILRGEIRRLFDWIKSRGLTAVITGERGDATLTRNGLEEYVSDCVILLDNRVEDQVTTRRLRIVKYRGSGHGTNEYPFLIDADGITVLPLTSSGLSRPVSNETVPSGIVGLDAMFGKGGFFRGSSILLSGFPGTGKTLFSSHFIDAACARGERCIMVLFEENAAEVCRNVRSVGIDLQQWVDAGLLHFEVARPSRHGFETHLARMYHDLDQFTPTIVAVDPISAFRGPEADVYSVLLRMVDILKSRGITALFTSLRSTSGELEGTDEGLSSVMDSWVKLLTIETNAERNRILYIVKSRGSSHSNHMREYRMTDMGIELIDAHIGAEGGMTGSARILQQAREKAGQLRRKQEDARRQRALARRRASIERQITDLRAALEGEEEEVNMLIAEDEVRDAALGIERRIGIERRSQAA